MSDIFQQDISDPNSPPNMQQEPATHTHIHNKEGNEATDPDSTFFSLKMKDKRVDEVPPSSTMEEVTRTDPALSPLKRKDGTDEVPRTDPAPSLLKRKEETDEATRTDPAPSLLTKDVQPKRVRGGHENGPVPFPLPNVASSKETGGNPTLHNLPLQESTYHRRGR
ncbi:hypothetical protein P9112_003126 [Eukaryota sp. TZLM1-RC]